MTLNDIKRKQLILIDYLQNLINNNVSNEWLVKAEYSTDYSDVRVVTVQEVQGEKVVFYGNATPLFNYYMVDIYGLSIQENKDLSLFIGNLIGESILLDVVYEDDDNKKYNEKWQLIFKQFTNPQAIMYEDIRRVGYNATLKCIVNKVASTLIEE